MRGEARKRSCTGIRLARSKTPGLMVGLYLLVSISLFEDQLAGGHIIETRQLCTSTTEVSWTSFLMTRPTRGGDTVTGKIVVSN